MNLALLNPFRQADRIDSTLTIPRALHPPRPTSDATTAVEGGINGGGGRKSTAAATADASVASADKAKHQSGDTFKIPKKPKLNTDDAAGAGAGDGDAGDGGTESSTNTKLFMQSLKLQKLAKANAAAAAAAAEGNVAGTGAGAEGGGGPLSVPSSSAVDAAGATDATKVMKEGESTTATSPTKEDSMDIDKPDATEKEVQGVADTEMKDANEPTTATTQDDTKETESTTTPTTTTPKPKKKRKKRGPKSATKDPSASSDEEDTPNNPTTNTENKDNEDDSDNYWTACYAVSFNKRGSFLASGHASALISVHDFLGRTTCGLYYPPPAIRLQDKEVKNGGNELQEFVYDAHYLNKEKKEGGSTKGSGGSKGAGEVKEKKKRGPKPKGKKRGPKPKNKAVAVAGVSGEGDVVATTEAAVSAAVAVLAANSPVKVSSSGDLLVGEEKAKEKEQLQQSVASLSASVAPSSSTPAAIYSNPSAKTRNAAATPKSTTKTSSTNNQLQYINGVTSLSWSSNSRTLLAGAIGDKNLRLMDNSHPLVSVDCTDAIRRQYLSESTNKDNMGVNEAVESLEDKIRGVVGRCGDVVVELPDDGVAGEERVTIRLETTSIGMARLLRSNVANTSMRIWSRGNPSQLLPTKGCLLSSFMTSRQHPVPSSSTVVTVPTRRHPTLLLELPHPLGGPAQLHPRDGHAGLACMIDGSLALFWMPPLAFYETLHAPTSGDKKDDTETTEKMNEDDSEQKKRVMKLLKEEESGRVGNLAFLVPPPESKSSGSSQSQYFVTCAAFGKRGDVLWAVTKCGNLLAFKIDSSMMSMLRGQSGGTSPSTIALANQKVKPALCVKVPGGAAAWQIIVSRNGRYILINSADCSLRLYDVDELTEAFEAPPPPDRIQRKADAADTEYTRKADHIKPKYVFQDNISKAPWASCDFSGDGEYVCGGCNSYPQPGDNYKLFLWNCITGELVDQLTGPVSSLYSLSCHPTRPFIAVGTSDGLVDVWGARLDWVAFAPDFQALQQNELYEEREDEFDVVVDSEEEEKNKSDNGKMDASFITPEYEDVDIVNIDNIPAFDSDSEDELDVFYIDTKVDKILSEKQPGPKKADAIE